MPYEISLPKRGTPRKEVIAFAVKNSLILWEYMYKHPHTSKQEAFEECFILEQKDLNRIYCFFCMLFDCGEEIYDSNSPYAYETNCPLYDKHNCCMGAYDEYSAAYFKAKKARYKNETVIHLRASIKGVIALLKMVQKYKDKM